MRSFPLLALAFALTTNLIGCAASDPSEPPITEEALTASESTYRCTGSDVFHDHDAQMNAKVRIDRASLLVSLDVQISTAEGGKEERSFRGYAQELRGDWGGEKPAGTQFDYLFGTMHLYVLDTGAVELVVRYRPLECVAE